MYLALNLQFKQMKWYLFYDCFLITSMKKQLQRASLLSHG